jgi:LmbE family N-acetylglucosaminyl deacetylase
LSCSTAAFYLILTARAIGLSTASSEIRRRKIMVVLDDTEVSRILVMAAHPDDVDFGAAGTVARWTEAGIEVVYCVVTDGDAGGSDRSVPRPDMATARRREQTEAADRVGVHDLRFLGYPDGRIEATLELRKDLARVIRQVRPDRVLCPSPERDYVRPGISHPDHRAVGSAALDAVYPDARNPFAFPDLLADEGLEPWIVREVWIIGTSAPTHYVDVTKTFPRKVAALRAHLSQTGDRHDLEDLLRQRLARAAAQGGLPEGSLAESFRVIDTG